METGAGGGAAGRFGAALATGVLLTGVDAAETKTMLQQWPRYEVKTTAKNAKNTPAACDLDFDGLDAGFSFLAAGGRLVFSFLAALSVFFVLLTFFTVNSSSSLSSGSL